MAVPNVNGIDSWAQFVKLVQEARARGTEYDGSVARSSFVKKGVSFSPAAPVRQQYGIVKSEQPGATQSMTGVKTKIAGTFFDAYA
jgi:hypothetical protein